MFPDALPSMDLHFLKKYNFKLKSSVCRGKYLSLCSMVLQGGG